MVPSEYSEVVPAQAPPALAHVPISMMPGPLESDGVRTAGSMSSQPFETASTLPIGWYTKPSRESQAALPRPSVLMPEPCSRKMPSLVFVVTRNTSAAFSTAPSRSTMPPADSLMAAILAR
ncbi:hypothetical protein D3C81_1586080 [compost metagenome]